MTFEEFKKNICILDKENAREIRIKYINTFVNCNSVSYTEQIDNKQEFTDGYCYVGYLWDHLKKPRIVDIEYLEKKKKIIENVFVFWDIHSCERILIKDYWKFDKDAVLQLDFSTLFLGERYLPEDIYIFDSSFSWTIVLTHEEINNKRYCIEMIKNT